MAAQMEVFIPSRSRTQRSLTLEALRGEWCDRHTFLVVPAAQARAYAALGARHNVRVLACPVNGIARTRQWIGQWATDKFLMLDDDLRFAYRASETSSITVVQPGQLNRCLHLVSHYLNHYVHVAIAARQAAHAQPLPAVVNSRPLRALAYRKQWFLKCVHGRVDIMEDFDVTLQLMRMGKPNLVITRYTQDQGQTQLPGGCSDYRTLELHERNVRKFAALHAPFVTLRDKQNKTGGEFGSRLEATIYWEKAYASAGTALRTTG
jgi:hypothetical protein